MNELALIRKLAARGGRGKGVIRGIGDDCAILRVPAGHDLLVHNDLTIEGVHFRRERQPAREIGAKALARVLSDFAAMGGEPRWALAGLVLPKWADERFVTGFYDGLAAMGGRYSVTIVGGDVSRGEQLVADLTLLGSAPRGKALRRDRAKPEDIIYVSGRLGRAASGGYQEVPEPRLELGKWLRGRATAAMDLSDGLAMDLHRLCWESGVAAELQMPLPVAPGATLEQALSGGEDYELLFTSRLKIPSQRRGLALTPVGKIVAGVKGRVKLSGKLLRPSGWDPFQK